MSLPQGAIWQRLRQRALDAIPIGSSVRFKKPATLASWQAQGTYTISATSTSKFTVVVQSADFGSALLSDAAFHLDHALEHQASMMKVLQGGIWASPAWQVVTFYYWAYFAAMALSRMLGRTVWFITPEVAKQFAALAPEGAPNVTQGTYEVTCEATVSAGVREVRLSKRHRRVHEQLWSTMFGLLDQVYSEIEPGAATQEEERLYLSLINSARVLGDDWPSALRNLVNYRPGFAYTAPRFVASVDSFTYLATSPQTIERIVGRLEDGNIAMRRDSDLIAQLKPAAKMLADVTLLLSRIAHALHDEIVDRDGVDRRWIQSRRRFAQEQGVITAGLPWPC